MDWINWFLDISHGLGGWAYSLWSFQGVQDWFMSVFQTDIAKMTVAFTIAAQLHRRWVKKDTAEQFGKITNAIEAVAERVTKGLMEHGAQLTKTRDEVKEIREKLHDTDAKVLALEQHNTQRGVQV